MDLRERFKEEIKVAMKAKEADKLSTLRMISAKLKDLDINARPKGIEAVSEDEVISMLKGMIKSRRESVDMYKQAGRDELVAKEEAEIAIIESFLPAQLDDAGMVKAVDEAIEKTGATSIKDMGKVMAFLKEHYGAVLDFSKVSPIIKTKFS